jgi:hypothetical protein
MVNRASAFGIGYGKTPVTRCKTGIVASPCHSTDDEPLFRFIHSFQHELLRRWQRTPHNSNRLPHNSNIATLSSLHRKCGRTDLSAATLADVQEFSYKESQETLAIPIGTVMSRLSRSRECLRTALASIAPARAAKA